MSIEELGPVNLNAIEQFEEINSRYTFLNEQRTDLRAAKTTLEQIIEEMDQEVKDRFKETFHAVQGYFAEVFKSLFGGGQAELRLTDDDYLTAGVDIIVRPPGKNYNISRSEWWRTCSKCNCLIICYLTSTFSAICNIR